MRVLGGPSVGDLRSRLIRLMDTLDENTTNAEMRAIKDLLSYRLPADKNHQKVRDEWALIVEGRHRYLYTFISQHMIMQTNLN